MKEDGQISAATVGAAAKACRTCGLIKASEAFHRGAATCKACTAEKQKQQRHTPEGRERRRQELARYRATEHGTAVHKESASRYRERRRTEGPAIDRQTRTCSGCGVEKPRDQFNANRTAADGLDSYCKPCRVVVNREYRARHPQRIRDRRRMRTLKDGYAMTPAGYAAMLASQGGVCAICGSASPGRQWPVFHVDHCHETGQVRGLLCTSCNNGLGRFGDDPARLRRAAAYLDVARLRDSGAESEPVLPLTSLALNR